MIGGGKVKCGRRTEKNVIQPKKTCKWSKKMSKCLKRKSKAKRGRPQNMDAPVVLVIKNHAPEHLNVQ